jgi:hypothetical protein
MFSILDQLGSLIQAIAILIPIGGLILGISAANSRFGGATLMIAYIIASLISAAFVYGFGGLIRVMVSMEENSRRTVILLEYMLKQRRESSANAPTGTRLRQVGKSE